LQKRASASLAVPHAVQYTVADAGAATRAGGCGSDSTGAASISAMSVIARVRRRDPISAKSASLTFFI
jgi:hypothetical protein